MEECNPMEQRIDKLEEQIDEIKDNHLSHLAQDVSELKADVKWIKMVGGFIVAESLAIIFKLFIK